MFFFSIFAWTEKIYRFSIADVENNKADNTSLPPERSMESAPQLHLASTFTNLCSYQMNHLSEAEFKRSAAFKR